MIIALANDDTLMFFPKYLYFIFSSSYDIDQLLQYYAEQKW